MKNLINITGVLDVTIKTETITDLLKTIGITETDIKILPHFDEWAKSLPKDNLPGLRKKCLNWIKQWEGGEYSQECCITDALDEIETDIPAKLADAIYCSIADCSKKIYDIDAVDLTIELIADSIKELLKETNTAYVNDNCEEFDKTKFYIDVCGGGWVRMVYYNPDSCAGGQLVYNLLSDYVISEAGKKHSADEEKFWDFLYENAQQTLEDIDTYDFAGYAKEFVQEPCDFVDQNADAIEKLVKWAEKSLNEENAQ